MEDWGVELEDFEVKRKALGGERGFTLHSDRLTIKMGEVCNRLPIMGPSGSGKTTLMNGLAGVSFPTSRKSRVRWTFSDGAVVEWGHDGPKSGQISRLRRKYFGYAFQQPIMLPHLTIGQNLTYALTNMGVSSRDAERKAHSILERFVHDVDPANLYVRYVSSVSGGQKQRIALIQSMIHDPYVLFADEPTGSLDFNTRRSIMKILTDWVDDDPDHRRLIWVTHHQDDPVTNNATQRLWIDQGRLQMQDWCGDSEDWRGAA